MATRAARPIASLALTLALALLAVLGGLLMSSEAANADPSCEVPPTDLASVLNDAGSGILLTWEASSCAPDEYAVYRRNMDEDGSKMRLFATVDGASLGYTDTAVDPGVTYRYRIRSNNQGPRSAFTEITAPASESDTENTESPEETPPEETPKSQLRAVNPIFNPSLPTTISVEENTSSGDNIGVPYTAMDADGDTLSYHLSGADESSFDIVESSGQLQTKSALDFETKSSYSVTVGVRDSSADTADDATIDVTITVTNADEAGTVTITGDLSGSSMLTASVTDIDGTLLSDVTWQWARGSLASGIFADIIGATSASYTPEVADLSQYLRVTATYTDLQGPGKTALAVTSGAIAPSNSEPTFSAENIRLDLDENSAGGVDVEAPVTATDEDPSDTLTYSLSDRDGGSGHAASFAVDSNGQITTVSSADYNFEAQDRYFVLLTVHDGKDAAGAADDTIDDTIELRIRLTNLDDPGSMSIGYLVGPGGRVILTKTDIDDPDGAVNTSASKWSRGDAPTGPFTKVAGSLSEYGTVGADVGKYIQAWHRYKDGHGTQKIVTAVTADPISASNTNPTFDQGSSITRSVPENSPADTSVGAAVMATDDEGGLVYRLGGPDGGSFGINTDGEIKTKSGITYNYESAKNTYSVTVSVHDRKDIASAPDTTIDDSIDVAISLTDANDAPTITSGDMTRTISENSTAVAAYMASDEDPSDTLSWSVENNADADDGNLFQINSAGELSFKIAPDFEDKQDVGKDNTYNVTVQATDGGGLYATRDVAVSVTNVNEAPTIDNGPSDGGTINTDENTSTTVTIATYEASDVDAGTNLMWTLEGDDEGGFTITKDLNTGNGVLRFSNVPNFEMPTDVGNTPGDNTYVVKVKVSDGSFSVTRTLTVNVENVNERPTITSGDMTRTIAENTTVVGAYTASDVDAGHTLTLMWDVETADDPELFQINSSSGELSFKSAPDFEDKQDAGTNNVYNVTVIVTDAGGLSATRRVAVTVTNVNEAPVFADDSTTGFIVNENLPASTALELFTATDQDAGTDLMWSLEGDDADQFRITENGQGRGVPKFLTSPNYEAPTDSDKDNVYKITLKVRDNHMPQMQPMLAVTVEVQDVNERPVISGSSTADFMEIEFDVDDADLTAMDFLVASFSAYDDDGDDVSWSLGTSEDKAHFVITKNADGEGVLSFAIRPDYENPVDMGSNNEYIVVLRANDGQNESNSVGTFSVTVRVSNVDETPEITTTGPTHATPSFAEIEYDATTADLTVADYDARDEERETITWGLGGDDAGDFTINRNSGVLSFARRPNFEIPVDGSTPPDNVYNIIVKATDASPTRKIREYPVAVAVTNVDETPEITNPPSDRSYAEIEYDSGSTATNIPMVATFTARDEEMQDITWDLSGGDAGNFTITKDPNTGNGVITFKTPPNFEVPDDDDSGNTYEFTVLATDTASPTNTGAWDYTLTVTDVNETPEFTGTIETSFTLYEHDANEVYTTPPLASYAARDEEGGVTWTLTGPDSRDFAIDGAGAVTFAATPSFETPTDSDRDNVYTFKVVATDVKSGSSRLTATEDVTVTVEDVEETGTIEVDNLNPAVGDLITFVLMDPDGDIDVSAGGSFRWSIQGRLPGAAWGTIPTSTPRATTGIYRADEDHTGFEIRAVADYSDRRGPGKSAESMATAAVAADPIINAPPRFQTGGTQRIAEVGAGGDVGERLTASDRDNDPITWGTSRGPGASFFEIDASSGQLRTLQALDFETTVVSRPFLFQVTLHDGRDADGNPDSSVDVTTSIEVQLIDVEELGVVTLSPDEPEVGDTVVATFEDGDGSVSDVSWQWARSEDGRTGWVNISGATSSSYTTLRSDAGSFLRASVRYTDRRGGGKTADAVTAARVFAENEPATFPSSEDGQRTVPENTPAGVNFGTPVAAEDPEGDGLTYTLRDPDAAAFSVVANSGQLQSSQPLDFETQPSYSFTIEVHDGRDGSGNPSTMVDDTQSVTITIENVEEPGAVALTTLTGAIQARVEVTAVLSDDDGPFGITWQWSRSPNGTTNWVNIASNVSATFTPTLEEDAGNYIRATATYTDGHGPNKTASAVSPRVGDPPPANSPPAFPATEDGQRDVPEDAAAGQDIGGPVVASDLNNDDLIYSLSGTASALFTIDEDTGQLRLASNAQLDFEEQRSHRVVVSVSDGADRNHDPDTVIDDTINVVITVTDVNEAPVITGDTSPSLPENASTPVATFTGADPERDTLAWSVDNRDFWISSRGQLYFFTPPSFEGGSTTHGVTVSAADDGGQSATLAVSVSVTDMEEEGVVTVTPPRGWADVATRFSAELTDDDGGETGIDWRWERSPNGRSGWVDIAGATSSSYTADAGDVGAYLRATAFYEDRRGSNKTAQSAPTGRIDELRPATNSAPAFGDTGTRSIAQGTAAGRAIGVPVQTTDEDTDDVLTYSLSGVDGDHFDIGRTTGQLRTKAVLDPQVQRIYAVTVSVHDGFDASYNPSEVEDDSTDVTITATEASTPVFGGGGGGGGGGPSGPSPSVVDFEWTVKHDLEALDESNGMPTGLWGRDGTLWVAQNGDGANDGVYAYDLETGERAEEREFELDERNRAPRGIWSDGETAWVSDSGRERVFAYSLATGDRLEEREIALAERNRDARGIWSDRETMWVLDGGSLGMLAVSSLAERFNEVN